MTQLTVQQVKELADGSWVNGNVTGQVTSAKNIQTKTGKTMGVAKLGDETGTIDLQSFDKSFMSVEGKMVELTGAGMKKDSYNDYAKLGVSGKTTMNVIEGGGDMPTPSQAPAAPSRPAVKDDDFVPQTLCHVMGAALTASLSDPASDGTANPTIMAGYMVAAYQARDIAATIIRDTL